MMSRTFLLFFIILLLSPVGFSSTDSNHFSIKTKSFEISIQDYEANQLIMLQGEFLINDYGRLKPLLDRVKNKDIILSLSGFVGGQIEVSAGLKKALRSKCPKDLCLITTVVISDGCLSSCISLYMLGDKRVAHKHAFFGFHGFHNFLGITLPTFMTINHYVKSGINLDWLREKRHFFEDKHVIWRLFPHQMEGSDIVMEIFD